MRVDYLALALDIAHLGVLEQVLDTADQGFDHLVLARHDRTEIEADIVVHLEAEVGHAWPGLFERGHRADHGLGWDTAPVQTGPADIVEVDDRNACAVLGGMDRRRVSTGSAANDHQVEIVLFVSHIALPSRRIAMDGALASKSITRKRVLKCPRNLVGSALYSHRWPYAEENVVPRAGLEPAWVAPGDFKSPVSAIPPPGRGKCSIAYCRFSRRQCVASGRSMRLKSRLGRTERFACASYCGKML